MTFPLTFSMMMRILPVLSIQWWIVILMLPLLLNHLRIVVLMLPLLLNHLLLMTFPLTFSAPMRILPVLSIQWWIVALLNPNELSRSIGATMIHWKDRFVEEDKLPWILSDHMVLHWIARPVDRDKLITHYRQSSADVWPSIYIASAPHSQATDCTFEKTCLTKATTHTLTVVIFPFNTSHHMIDRFLETTSLAKRSALRAFHEFLQLHVRLHGNTPNRTCVNTFATLLIKCDRKSPAFYSSLSTRSPLDNEAFIFPHCAATPSDGSLDLVASNVESVALPLESHRKVSDDYTHESLVASIALLLAYYSKVSYANMRYRHFFYSC
jgi:hypothetical protein